MASESESGPEERGVFNPKVVDLVSFDDGAVILTMIEDRPWGASPDQIRQIEEKFNSYLGYVGTQGLERQYPQYAGVPVVFRLDCAFEPGPQERAFLESVTRFAAGENIRFVVRVREES